MRKGNKAKYWAIFNLHTLADGSHSTVGASPLLDSYCRSALADLLAENRAERLSELREAKGKSIEDIQHSYVVDQSKGRAIAAGCEFATIWITATNLAATQPLSSGSTGGTKLESRLPKTSWPLG
jgi:hypothetical protein